MKKGDAIAAVAQPIAWLVDVTLGTDLQHCGGCHRMQENLNAGMSLADAFYDRFWPQQEMKNMEWIVTKQVRVKADSPEEAVSKIGSGTTIAMTVNMVPTSVFAQTPPEPKSTSGALAGQGGK